VLEKFFANTEKAAIFNIFLSRKKFWDTIFSGKTDLVFPTSKRSSRNAKSVFSLKNVSQKFFLLKNMLKIAAFSLLAKNFSGTI